YTTYTFLPGGDILAIARSSGRDRLIRVARDGTVSEIDLPYTEMNALSVDGDRVVLRAAGPDRPAAVIELDLAGDVNVLRTANPNTPEPEDVAIPEHIEFPTEGGRTAFGNFYAPTNRSFRAPDGELPPLIVTSHGGPTAAAFSGFATGMQLFTSRGYAVLDVDYGGSTGYREAHRNGLAGGGGGG